MRVSLAVLIPLLPLIVPSPVRSAPVIINEIMYDPARVSDTAGEWFEVYNPGPGPVDLDGWTIRDGGRDVHPIAPEAGLVVAPGGYRVLGRDGDPLTNGGYTPDYVYDGFTLSNGEDEIVLVDPLGTAVDSVAYGRDGWPVGAGKSIELIEGSPDNGVGASWLPAATPYGNGDQGTPGAPNDAGPTGIRGEGGSPPGTGHPAMGAFPNPFTTATTIRIGGGVSAEAHGYLDDADGSAATLDVYDLRGRRVRRLWCGPAGACRTVVWDGRDDRGAALPPGAYILRLVVEGGDIRQKVVIAGG